MCIDLFFCLPSDPVGYGADPRLPDRVPCEQGFYLSYRAAYSMGQICTFVILVGADAVYPLFHSYRYIFQEEHTSWKGRRTVMRPSYYNHIIENKTGSGDALYYNMRTGSLAHMKAEEHCQFQAYAAERKEVADP